MSTLYSVGFISCDEERFAFEDAELAKCAEASWIADLVPESMDGVPHPKVLGLIIDRLRTAGPAAVSRALARMVRFIEEPRVDPVDVEAAMRNDNGDVWSVAVGEISTAAARDAPYVARNILLLQDLCHRALPKLYSAPRAVGVKVQVDAVHPDVRRIDVDAAFAIRLLLDAYTDHPLNALFPDPTDPECPFIDIVLRLAHESAEHYSTAGGRRPDPEEVGLPAVDIHVWIPPSLVGDLVNHQIWESAAYASDSSSSTTSSSEPVIERPKPKASKPKASKSKTSSSKPSRLKASKPKPRKPKPRKPKPSKPKPRKPKASRPKPSKRAESAPHSEP